MTVVDASVALKWFIEEAGTPEARQLLAADAPLAAPELIVAEVCNAAWKLQRLGILGDAQYGAIASGVTVLVDRLVPFGPLAPRAAEMAWEMNHPAYDCFYLALAEREADVLVSADRRLLERTRRSRWRGLVRNLRGRESSRRG